MNLNTVIEAKRIRLVAPSMELQPQMLEAIVASKDELAAFLPWVPYALTQADSEKNTKQAMDNFESFNNELRFSIVDKSNNKLVGAIGLLIKDKSVPYFEIGYWVRTDCMGNGYISEAVRALEKYAFEVLNAQRIEIRCDDSNIKSKSVAQRCGYQFEGVMKNTNRLPSGELSSTLVFAKMSVNS